MPAHRFALPGVMIAALLATSGQALAASPPEAQPGAVAPGDDTARATLDAAREAVKAARSFGTTAIVEGDWSKHGGAKVGGRYNVAALRADAGGWMIRAFGEGKGQDAPPIDIAFDGVTARATARADKTIHEMAPANADETRGFFAAQHAAAPVPWDLLAGFTFPDGVRFRAAGRQTVANTDCELVSVAVPDDPVVLTIAFGVEDHLPRRFEWRSGDASRSLTLAELRPNRPLSPSNFIVSAPSDFVVKPIPSPSRQAQREEPKPLVEAPRPAAPAKPREVAVGKPAPAFALKNPEDETVSLEGLKGSVVLMDFWATWCGPCKAAMPSLQEFHEAYESKGLKVIGVNAWERGDPVKFKKEKGYTYGLLLNGDETAKAYGVSGIPAFFLVDREGNLAWKGVGWGPGSKDSMKKAIEDALGQAGGN
ncbi:MAG: TlpA family protein disulfide reductase [Phycisphaerae bacterium]|nr:TlpA family protein disulfide reductase [Phycisphaerae bacterium]